MSDDVASTSNPAQPRAHTAHEHLSLRIANNRIYHHRVCRINYTTYDVRRAQDSINPRTHADISTLR